MEKIKSASFGAFGKAFNEDVLKNGCLRVFIYDARSGDHRTLLSRAFGGGVREGKEYALMAVPEAVIRKQETSDDVVGHIDSQNMKTGKAIRSALKRARDIAFPPQTGVVAIKKQGAKTGFVIASGFPGYEVQGVATRGNVSYYLKPRQQKVA